MHRELGAKMVPFAGYEMPVQYPTGIIYEHLHTRTHASLFDIAHMGQIEISGLHALRELGALLPLDLDTLLPNRMAYSFLPNEQGGVIDDVIATRRGTDHFLLVVNAGCKDKVMWHLSQHLSAGSFHLLDEQVLLALQGPASLRVLGELFHEDIAGMPFMSSMRVKTTDGIECFVSRCGYTGEDGFEISLPVEQAEKIARQLLHIENVKPAGLGARDSLRLEAGLCLYGHELNEDQSAIAAGLGWTISPSRRVGNKAGGFIGADVILHQLKNGTAQKRVGLLVQAKVPVREGTILRDANDKEAGVVTSGTFSPSLSVPIAMAYVDANMAAIGTRLKTEVRNKPVELLVSRLPFVAHRYARS
jgi:aminomethyltransferase